MTWNAQSPRPSDHRGKGVYSARRLTDADMQLASTVVCELGLKTLIIF